MISVDSEGASDDTENIEASREEKHGTPCGTGIRDDSEKDGEAVKQATDSESWVRTAPRVLPTAAPRGAPAAKVANAMDLILEGGNAWARIPS